MIIKNNGFTIAELIVVVIIIAILAAIIVPGSNFSYVASSIISESEIASEPLKQAVEQHYLKYNKFPNKQNLQEVLNSIKKPKRVSTIELLPEGRIKITFDASDIEIGGTWWHSLNNPLSNDLTGKDLILVPTVKNDKLIWDECNYGSVPMRNRHYKCSGHK